MKGGEGLLLSELLGMVLFFRGERGHGALKVERGVGRDGPMEKWEI